MNEATTVHMGTRVRGSVRGERDLVVEGRLAGSIRVEGDLLVTEDGVVRGDVRARSVRVEGVVVGTIVADVRIEIAKSARIAGDLCAPSIEVDPGAAFRGEILLSTPLAGVANEAQGVLSQPVPGRARPIPRRPPSSIMPVVGRSQGRMRAYG